MREYRTMRMLVLYYLYLSVLMLFTAYIHWFHADIASGVMLLVLLFLPYLAGKFLYRDKALIRQMENRKGAACHEEFFAVFFGLSVWGMFGSDITPNYILYCLLGCAGFVIYLFSKYYSGKYLTLYCNPSVTKNTQMRAERGNTRSFARILLISLLVGLFLSAVIYSIKDVEPEPVRIEWKNKEKSTKKEKIQEQSQSHTPNFPELQERGEEGIAATIIRYVLLLTMAFGIVFILILALLKLYSFLFDRRRKGKTYEYQERLVETKENEEYVELVPVARKQRHFPDGNNGKIRRKFYQRVRRGAGKKSVNLFYTPKELGEHYLKPGEDSSYLITLYEKARYSQSPVTDEEISRWEKLEKGK